MKKPEILLVYCLAVIKFIFPFVLQDVSYLPHRDEFLYFEQGNHVALGYLENPPLIGWLAYISQLLGGSFFTLKLWPSLFGALTYLFTGKIIIALGGRFYAVFLAFLAFVFGAYLRMHYLFQPNFLEIFFYTLIAYALVQYIISQKNIWLYLWGIACGLGMLSKYSVAFFIVSILIGLAISNQRKIYFNYHFYLAGLVGLILFAPNVYWQISHNYPLKVHMLELQETQLQYNSAGDFIKDQLLFLLGGVFIWTIGLLYILLTKKGRVFLVFFIAYFIEIGLLIYCKGKSYYAMGLYPVLIAFGAFNIERLTTRYVRILRYVLITPLFYVGYISMPLTLPILPPEKLASMYEERNVKQLGVLKWEDQKDHAIPQDFADMVGWKEVVERAANCFHTMNEEDKPNTIILCRNYGFAGAFNYYRKLYNLPPAISDNGSFLLWMPDTFHITNIILIGHKMPDATEDVFNHFNNKYVGEEYKDNEYFREKGIKIMLFLKASPQVNTIAQNKVAEMKKKFKG